MLGTLLKSGCYTSNSLPQKSLFTLIEKTLPSKYKVADESLLSRPCARPQAHCITGRWPSPVWRRAPDRGSLRTRITGSELAVVVEDTRRSWVRIPSAPPLLLRISSLIWRSREYNKQDRLALCHGHQETPTRRRGRY